MKLSLRIATRKSPLALWQANFVKEEIQRHHQGVEIDLLGMLTTADKMLATPLNKIGGKGLFVKELEKAILERQADIAVHSIKDLPAEMPDGLELAIILKREDPRDVFVSNQYKSLSEMPKKSVIGTSSLRRKAQILAMRPDLCVKPLRGNVGTRLQKLDENEFDAIILAAAGLKRLREEDRISFYFSTKEMVPAVGQGAIGIECRCKDTPIFKIISFLEDPYTRYEITAERMVSKQLGGSCQFPIAAHAFIENDTLTIEALVGDPEGKTLLKTIRRGKKEDAATIGLQAAEDLIGQGALQLLNKVTIGNSYDAS